MGSLSILTAVAVLLAALAGAAVWTGTEYFAHRFTMHNTGGRGPAAGEHLRHHAMPARTRPLMRIIGHCSMYAIAVAIGFVLNLIVPLGLAAGFAVGWALGYTLYEGLHHAAHHSTPRGAWDLRLRRRHFHHHFAAPKQNLGVLVSAWDQWFGTEGPSGPVRVPQRLAMPWLVDHNGAVRAEFAADYVIVESKRPRTPDAAARADLERAFADLAPTAD